MAEARPRPRHGLTGAIEDPQDGGPGECPEDEEHARRVEDLQLASEKRRAGVALIDRRLVQRRRAANRGRDPGAGQDQPVIRPPARGLVRDPGPMECRPQEVAARVAGEDAAGSIAAMGGRREPHDENARVGIPEAGQRSAPVRLVAVAGDLLAGDPLAPRDEPWAPTAFDDLALELVERGAPPLRRRLGYLRSSLSRRRDTTMSPPMPIRAR